jgi:AraC family transcriptional regulator of adaptative response / DNA-3-methyladenine glycosylase II
MRLAYQGPYDWGAMLTFLAARAIEGVEQVEDGAWRRSFRTGVIEVRHLPEAKALEVSALRGSLTDEVLARVRRVFDLDADVGLIGAHLSRDPFMAALVAARPGLRAPGGFDGFELGVRAILGQQISVEAARRLAGRLVRLCGDRMPDAPEALAWLFPTPAELAAADLGPMPMPGARKAALTSLAEAALADPALFERGDSLEHTLARLCAVRGIGSWSAHYIALRAAREPDAFPASDIGLLRGAADASGRPTPKALLERAEAWRPWRAYAAQHLWAADAPSAISRR